MIIFISYFNIKKISNICYWPGLMSTMFSVIFTILINCDSYIVIKSFLMLSDNFVKLQIFLICQ